MKLKRSVIFAFLLAAAVTFDHRAQEPIRAADDGWIRVLSNDGEFSMEVPAAHAFYVSADGFSVSNGNADIRLRNMYALNGYHEETLVSFEMYDGGKAAMDILYDHDVFAKQGRKVSGVQRGTLKIKQVTNKTDQYYSIRQFFSTGGRVYVLTAAAREGETPAMLRFLNSLTLGKEDVSKIENGRKFSSLKVSTVEVDSDLDAELPPRKRTPAKRDPPPPNEKRYVIVRTARPSYVGSARDRGVKGAIRVKLVLAENGFIPKITVLRTLPEGLLRQAIFAAVRTKFLPMERDGKAIPIKVTIEYSFHIY